MHFYRKQTDGSFFSTKIQNKIIEFVCVHYSNPAKVSHHSELTQQC